MTSSEMCECQNVLMPSTHPAISKSPPEAHPRNEKEQGGFRYTVFCRSQLLHRNRRLPPVLHNQLRALLPYILPHSTQRHGRRQQRIMT